MQYQQQQRCSSSVSGGAYSSARTVARANKLDIQKYRWVNAAASLRGTTPDEQK